VHAPKGDTIGKDAPLGTLYITKFLFYDRKTVCKEIIRVQGTDKSKAGFHGRNPRVQRQIHQPHQMRLRLVLSQPHHNQNPEPQRARPQILKGAALRVSWVFLREALF
jgi:hypothetical protein